MTKKILPGAIIVLSVILALGSVLYINRMPASEIPQADVNDMVPLEVLNIEGWPSKLPPIREAAGLDYGANFWLITTPLSISQATSVLLDDLEKYGWSAETVTDGRNTNIVASLPTGELVGVDITKKSYKEGPTNWVYLKIFYLEAKSESAQDLIDQT